MEIETIFVHGAVVTAMTSLRGVGETTSISVEVSSDPELAAAVDVLEREVERAIRARIQSWTEAPRGNPSSTS